MRLSQITNRYGIWDARALDAYLPRRREFLDVTITSPPYWNIKDYGAKAQIGFGQSYADYLDDLEAVFRAIHRSTKPTGSMWVVADTLKEDGELRLLPFDLAERAKRSGWFLQDIIIWQKDRTLPWSHQGKLRNIFEYVTFFSKTKTFKYHLSAVRDVVDLKDHWIRFPERYNPGGKTPSRSWSIPIPRQGAWGKAANFVQHACPLPTELVQRILELTTEKGDVVFDPFAGSGAVLAAAHWMERRYIGIDLNRNYQKLFYSRVLPETQKREPYGISRPNPDGKAEFAQTIRQLRCNKYARELARLYAAKYGSPLCGTMVLIPSAGFDQLELFLCRSSRISRETLATRLNELTRRRPLSKFGLKSEIRLVPSPKALKQLLSHRETAGMSWYRYDSGKFYWYVAELGNTREHVLHATNFSGGSAKYPLVISPLRLRVPATK
ncbi:MAG TPA: site-specific DNA-methyltransferase [Bryobacteraceae bacterium]|nr:site-specific DNA-methyltransferase [Bryobacteraceae bacterium]